MKTEQEVIKAVSNATGHEFAAADRLPGGWVNYVWRVADTRGQTVVAKFFSDHLARAPEVAINIERWKFESQGAVLGREIIGPEYVPKVAVVVDEQQLVVLEDLGESPSLLVIVGSGQALQICKKVGELIGGLHHDSQQHAAAKAHDNVGVQQARANVQYGGFADLVPTAGPKIVQRVEAYGQALLKPGRCLVMGDLWPESVLVRDGEPTFIDWEFSHFGQPEQDAAHMAAHLWMCEDIMGVQGLHDAFMTAYKDAAGDLVDEQFWDGFYIHYACEILARTVGPFQANYLYDGTTDGMIEDAVEHAMDALIRRYPE